MPRRGAEFRRTSTAEFLANGTSQQARVMVFQQKMPKIRTNGVRLVFAEIMSKTIKGAKTENL